MPVGNKPVAAITGSCPNHHARDQLGQRPEQGRRRWCACATRRRLKVAPVERIDRQPKRVQKPLLSLSEKRERSGAGHNSATIHHPGAREPVPHAQLRDRTFSSSFRQNTALERATGIEPVTSSLGSWHSTAELRPLACFGSVWRLRLTVKRSSAAFSAARLLAEHHDYISLLRAGSERRSAG